ncbi:MULTISPECIES: hypothetical protein [unclassified Cupriavidus]|uniref:hypothetical protein n=1 Tax=unclassified Cupriavidus TaxID=2640874 RepID=UPI00295EEA53|nr:hypothetical protein [Cupriavidus sp. TA19]
MADAFAARVAAVTARSSLPRDVLDMGHAANGRRYQRRGAGSILKTQLTAKSISPHPCAPVHWRDPHSTKTQVSRIFIEARLMTGVSRGPMLDVSGREG